MNTIVAAASDDVRARLADITRAAGYAVDAVVSDTGALKDLLRSSAEPCVVTGGAAAEARPFLNTARAADAAAVALVAGHDRRALRADPPARGTAILSASVSPATFRIAVSACRAGLALWDPVTNLREEPRLLESPLSPRERDVLELAGAGLSTKAVARQLGISPNTVKFHLQAAFEKLGATSRAEAIMVAIRRGELPV
jgi:DNA-binding NarL/FixJ family response regulator